MDSPECVAILVSRCVVLISYHYRRAREGAGKAEMHEGSRWLAKDALRRGVRPEVLAAGVLAELRREHGAEAASDLIGDLEGALGLVHARA